jgi:hypothetical protein
MRLPPALPGEPRLEKEPLVTGHPSHDELVEDARLDAAASRFGHGIPLFPQALLYLLVVALLVALVWWQGWF